MLRTKCTEFKGDNLEELNMSIFGNIVSAIFGHSAVGTTAAAGSAAAPGAPAPQGTPTVAGPAATGSPMTRQQVEEELLVAVQKAEHEMRKSTGKCLPPARRAYQDAIKRLNDFVIKGRLPEENE